MQIPCIFEKDSKETLKAVLRKAYKTQEVMHAPPVAVEHVKNKGMLCYLFNVPDTRVYMPATEVGLPVFNGDLWKYLSLNRQQRHYVKRSMINLLSSAHAFPFIVTHSARDVYKRQGHIGDMVCFKAGVRKRADVDAVKIRIGIVIFEFTEFGGYVVFKFDGF